MGNLKTQIIDFNNIQVVTNLRNSIQHLITNKTLYFSLEYEDPAYFNIPGILQPPQEPGWYVILHQDTKRNPRIPIYVGETDNLNNRLNSHNDTRDNFQKLKRLSDPERNFIKKFDEIQFITPLQVCIIKQVDLCNKLNISSNIFNKFERQQVEKFINIIRGMLIF